jgi:hypothetical protein
MLLLLVVSCECCPKPGQVEFYPVLPLDCLLCDWLAVRVCRSGWANDYQLAGCWRCVERAVSGHVGCSHNSVLNISTAQCTTLYKKYGMFICSGTAVAQWLRYYATNQKVAGSIPDGVSGIFHWHNPSDRTMALGSTQPLAEMSTRSISWG